MSSFKGSDGKLVTAKRNMAACETPDCSANCAYAYSCHESRMGRMSVVFWPGVGILTLLGVALIF